MVKALFQHFHSRISRLTVGIQHYIGELLEYMWRELYRSGSFRYTTIECPDKMRSVRQDRKSHCPCVFADCEKVGCFWKLAVTDHSYKGVVKLHLLTVFSPKEAFNFHDCEWITVLFLCSRSLWKWISSLLIVLSMKRLPSWSLLISTITLIVSASRVRQYDA